MRLCRIFASTQSISAVAVTEAVTLVSALAWMGTRLLCRAANIEQTAQSHPTVASTLGTSVVGTMEVARAAFALARTTTAARAAKSTRRLRAPTACQLRKPWQLCGWSVRLQGRVQRLDLSECAEPLRVPTTRQLWLPWQLLERRVLLHRRLQRLEMPDCTAASAATRRKLKGRPGLFHQHLPDRSKRLALSGQRWARRALRPTQLPLKPALDIPFRP